MNKRTFLINGGGCYYVTVGTIGEPLFRAKVFIMLEEIETLLMDKKLMCTK